MQPNRMPMTKGFKTLLVGAGAVVLLAIIMVAGFVCCEKPAPCEEQPQEPVRTTSPASETNNVVSVANESADEERMVTDDAREWADSWRAARKRLAAESVKERLTEPVDDMEVEKKRLQEGLAKENPEGEVRLTYITSVLSGGDRLDDWLGNVKESLTNDQSIVAYYLDRGSVSNTFCHYERQDVKKPGGRVLCQFAFVRGPGLAAAMDSAEPTPWVIWRVKGGGSSRDKVYWQWLRQSVEMPLFEETRTVDLTNVFFGDSAEVLELWRRARPSSCIGIGTSEGTLYVDSFSVTFDSLLKPLSAELNARLSAAEAELTNKRDDLEKRNSELADWLSAQKKLVSIIESARRQKYRRDSVLMEMRDIVVNLHLVSDKDFKVANARSYLAMVNAKIRNLSRNDNAEEAPDDTVLARLREKLEKLEKSLLTKTYRVTMEVDGPPSGKFGFQPKRAN